MSKPVYCKCGKVWFGTGHKEPRNGATIGGILHTPQACDPEIEKIGVPKDVLHRICGMVYATRGEQHRLGYITDEEYGKLVSLRHGGHDSIDTVLTALGSK